jgi:hypothetical protein
MLDLDETKVEGNVKLDIKRGNREPVVEISIITINIQSYTNY